MLSAAAAAAGIRHVSIRQACAGRDVENVPLHH